MTRTIAKPDRRATGTSAGFRTRPALRKDEDALAALRRQAEEAHARLLPDYFRVAQSHGALAASASASASSVILVAEETGPASAVVGYASLRVVETPRDPAMTPRRRAHIETVVVAETHRRRGIGTALMRAAATWAARRQAAELVLTVWSDNRAAEALYRRLGYQPIARVLRLPLS